VPSREFLTHSSEETIARGREIGQQLKPPVLVLLSGDLGAGKTTLTKGIATGLRAAEEDEVTSPTFTLVHKYERDSRVYHVDLYRIGDIRDLETLGLEDVFSEKAVVIVEWPDRLALRTDWPTVRIYLEHVSEDTRRIRIVD
jgi:tRNA threonylcarbamoyladenosine biosynthesis protein TsaE